MILWFTKSFKQCTKNTLLYHVNKSRKIKQKLFLIYLQDLMDSPLTYPSHQNNNICNKDIKIKYKNIGITPRRK